MRRGARPHYFFFAIESVAMAPVDIAPVVAIAPLSAAMAFFFIAFLSIGLAILSLAMLSPAILWSDQRTAAECQEITDRIGAAELLRLTGNRALPGFTAPKLLWVHDHQPQIFAKVVSNDNWIEGGGGGRGGGGYHRNTFYVWLYPFEAAWPVLGGYGVYRGAVNAAPAAYWWIDETKEPFKKG